MSPGPTMASSVLSFAEVDERVPVSSTEMVPKAPLMSPTCAESKAAVRPGTIKLGLVVAMTNDPFHPRLCGFLGDTRRALLVLAGSLPAVRAKAAHARARNGHEQRRMGPMPARSIVFHDSPPFTRCWPSSAAYRGQPERCQAAQLTPAGRRRTLAEAQAPLSLELWHSTA